MSKFNKFLERLKKMVDYNNLKDGNKVLTEKEVIVGYGNYDSKILFVGKESTESPEKACNSLFHNLNIQERPNWTRKRIDEEVIDPKTGKKRPNYWSNSGTLWWKYQTLIDYVRFDGLRQDRSKEFDFENFVYCTEMNNSHSKRTSDADKSTIDWRKKLFFKDPYFKDFSVIVLACSNYISGPEIEEIFDVTFTNACTLLPNSHKRKGTMNDTFWCHLSNDGKRLVIHACNLSGAIKDGMLKWMAQIIESHLKKNGHFDLTFNQGRH